MGRNAQVIMLILIIVATVGGVLYFMDTIGMVDVSQGARDIGGSLPWVGSWLRGPLALPATEVGELERLQEARAREDQWALLTKSQEELSRAEKALNEERARLEQWEQELERREEAITNREGEFTDREAQYKRAVQFYLSMRPAAAAKVLSQQEDLLVIEIFRRMPERNVSAIMAEMDPAVAGAIMRKMSR